MVVGWWEMATYVKGFGKEGETSPANHGPVAVPPKIPAHVCNMLPVHYSGPQFQWEKVQLSRLCCVQCPYYQLLSYYYVKVCFILKSGCWTGRLHLTSTACNSSQEFYNFAIYCLKSKALWSNTNHSLSGWVWLNCLLWSAWPTFDFNTCKWWCDSCPSCCEIRLMQENTRGSQLQLCCFFLPTVA